jgi:hypothetical protein
MPGFLPGVGAIRKRMNSRVLRPHRVLCGKQSFRSRRTAASGIRLGVSRRGRRGSGGHTDGFLVIEFTLEHGSMRTTPPHEGSPVRIPEFHDLTQRKADHPVMNPSALSALSAVTSCSNDERHRVLDFSEWRPWHDVRHIYNRVR